MGTLTDLGNRAEDAGVSDTVFALTRVEFEDADGNLVQQPAWPKIVFGRASRQHSTEPPPILVVPPGPTTPDKPDEPQQTPQNYPSPKQQRSDGKRHKPKSEASSEGHAKSFEGVECIDDLVKAPYMDLADVHRVRHAIMEMTAAPNEEVAAQGLMLLRNVARHKPTSLPGLNYTPQLRDHLNSRNRLLRACSAAALAAITASPLGRDVIFTQKDLLRRLASMLRCGIHSLDAATASLAIANAAIHHSVKEFLATANVVKVLVWLVRQAVRAPLPGEDDGEEVAAAMALADGQRHLARTVEPRVAAINAATALCNIVDHAGCRQLMIKAGVERLLFEANQSKYANVLKERCELLNNWLGIHAMRDNAESRVEASRWPLNKTLHKMMTQLNRGGEAGPANRAGHGQLSEASSQQQSLDGSPGGRLGWDMIDEEESGEVDRMDGTEGGAYRSIRSFQPPRVSNAGSVATHAPALLQVVQRAVAQQLHGPGKAPSAAPSRPDSSSAQYTYNAAAGRASSSLNASMGPKGSLTRSHEPSLPSVHVSAESFDGWGDGSRSKLQRASHQGALQGVGHIAAKHGGAESSGSVPRLPSLNSKSIG